METSETTRELIDAKEMRKLSRGEILEMLLLQSEEIEKQKKEIEELTARLEDRAIAIDKAGTLAEASILISNVLREADNAAKDYLYNMEKLSGDAERISQAKLAEAKIKADAEILGAKERAETELTEAKQRASELVLKAQQEADSIVSKAAVQRDRIRREADSYWTEVSVKMEAFYREHKGLREMLNSFGGTIDK